MIFVLGSFLKKSHKEKSNGDNDTNDDTRKHQVKETTLKSQIKQKDMRWYFLSLIRAVFKVVS